MEQFDFQSEWGDVKHDLAGRLREVRVELYGEHGGPILAKSLEIPYRTWVRFEAGASMPAQVMLRLLELTAVNPHWLLTGEGPKFAPARGEG